MYTGRRLSITPVPNDFRRRKLGRDRIEFLKRDVNQQHTVPLEQCRHSVAREVVTLAFDVVQRKPRSLVDCVEWPNPREV